MFCPWHVKAAGIVPPSPNAGLRRSIVFGACAGGPLTVSPPPHPAATPVSSARQVIVIARTRAESRAARRRARHARSADRESPASEHAAVSPLGALAVAGPDVPAVRARREPLPAAVEAPCAAQLEPRAPWPGAQHLALSSVELDVVVAGLGRALPAQSRRPLRRGTDARSQQPRRRLDRQRPARCVAGGVDRGDPVAVAHAVAKVCVAETRSCALEQRMRRAR